MKKTFQNIDFDFVYDVDSNLGGGEWDQVAEWCVKNVSSENTFLELGAHLGYMSVITMKLAHPKLGIFVEPDPRTVFLLQENLRRNILDTNYHIVPYAVWEKETLLNFYLNCVNPAQNSVHKRNFNEMAVVKIPTLTVDQIVKKYLVESPIVMKIDCEMAEPWIWKGMKRTLPMIKAICMEYHPPGLIEAGINPEEFLEEIKNDGFRIENLNNTNICLYPK